MKTEVDPRKVNLAEKDIEDWLWGNPEALHLIEWVGRQVRVPSGIIDLLGYDTDLNPVVCEVKNVEVSADAILQVCRYAMDVQAIIREGRSNDEYFDVKKIVVFRGEASSEIIYEAMAVRVNLRSFEVKLDLDISGGWGFTKEKTFADCRARGDLSKSDIFQSLVMLNNDPDETANEQPEDPLLPFKKFIDNADTSEESE